jgi:hypothetical protein
MALSFGFLFCLQGIKGAAVDDEKYTEDHYYVENTSRKPFFMLFVTMVPVAWLFIWGILPDQLKYAAPINETEVLNFDGVIKWQSLAFCVTIGLAVGLAVSVLAEYFTAQSCPPARVVG